MEFYDCLKVVGLYPSVVYLWVLLLTIYTNNSLYTFSKVCTDLLSSAQLTGGVSNATTPQYELLSL